MAERFTLRGYAVERCLGGGSSGQVWRARVGSSGATVALKRIPTAGPQQRDRALAEGALLANLDHPNLVRLHAVVPTADAVVLVLDLADGGSLADLLAARGRLDPGEVITALAPIAAALACVHAAGYVHGDVSPGNVLFTADGVPMLTDLGVARLIGAAGPVEATPAYVDPAVAAGAVPAPPSDVFMLGGVALHALTGAPPWPVPETAGRAAGATVEPAAGTGATAEPAAAFADALAVAASGCPVDAVRRLQVASVPPAMASVIARALDLDPHRRGSAADLALELRHSGRPVAVELSAGRARPVPAAPWTGPRHLARPLSDSGEREERAERAPGPLGRRAPASAAGPASEAGPADPARPAFTRPAEVAGPEPPTRMVGPRPRPVIPRPRRRRPSRRLVGGVAAGVFVAGGLGVAAAALFGPAWGDGHHDKVQRHPAVGTAPRSAEAPEPAGASTSRPVPGTTVPPSVRGRPSGSWIAALGRLDAARAAAYAGRDPAALRRVYSDASLAATDVAQLTRLVPSGCGLRGVRTQYADVRVTVSGARATVLVQATLPPSQLVCGGSVRATLPGAGPTRLRVELVRTSGGVRLAAQTLVAG
jgi:serine/threonine protein kinase